jgi:hypothetical protein
MNVNPYLNYGGNCEQAERTEGYELQLVHNPETSIGFSL